MIGAVLQKKYRVLGLLADGGMGRVYHGEHLRLKRRVAVKCVLPRFSAEPTIVRRFRAEAQMCAQLSHANVVKVLDFGQREAELGGELYTVMEFVEGDTLERLLESGHQFDFRRITSIMEQLLIALDYAHEHGVVHRDIKPANIVIQPALGGAERVILIDFGIAQAEVNAATETTGTVLGTPEFMAPEQVHGYPVTPAVDIYSAGVILFQLLTGVLPFTGHSVISIFQQHLSAARPDPRALCPERRIPDELALVCMKALSIEADERFASAYDFSEAIVHARRSLLPRRSAYRLTEEVGDTNSCGVRTFSGAPNSRAAEAGERSPPASQKKHQLQDPPGYERGSSQRPAQLPPQWQARSQCVVPSLGKPPAAPALDQPELSELRRIEEEAEFLIQSGSLEEALAKLLGGLSVSRAVLRKGDRKLGQSAAKSFADKLRQLYQLLGQAERAAAVAGATGLVPASSRRPLAVETRETSDSRVSGTVTRSEVPAFVALPSGTKLA